MLTSTSLKTKPLSKSVNLSTTKSSMLRSKTLKNEAKSLLNSATLENIEIEYIKNLQQQVYFLELECNYLRQQLNLNGLQTSLKYDTKSQQLKDDMLIIQNEKNSLERSLIDENKQKETVLNVLEQTEKSFHKERELLLKEINSLKKQKQEAEESLVLKNIELSKTKENLTKHHLNSHDSLDQLSKIELQMESLRKDNHSLRAELNEARSHLISRDNLIKDLQHQLADSSLRKSVNFNSSLTNINDTKLHDDFSRLSRDLENSKLKINELSKENARLTSTLEISLKQNEADLIMAKKNADLTKENLEKLHSELENERNLNSSLKTQVEQFKLQERLEIKNQGILKKRIADLEEIVSNHDSIKEQSQKLLQDQLRNKQREHETDHGKWVRDHNDLMTKNKAYEVKINELNDQLDKLNLNNKVTIESLKTKVKNLQLKIDEETLNLNNEKTNGKALQSKIESLVRQESILSNLIVSLKSRVSELEGELHEKRSTEKESTLLNQLNDSNHKLANLEEENHKLRLELESLRVQLKEIDRLKHMEDVLVTSMKSLSRTVNINDTD